MTESECAIECEGRRAARYTGTCCEFDFIVTLMNYFLRLVALLSACWVTGSGAQSAPPIFVLNSQDANITVIDPQTWAPIKQIPTGKEPHHLYLTPDEKSVIVANAGADSLTFIDPRTAEVQRVVRNTLDPYHLRFSPDMKWFVTVANRLNHIDIYRWDGQNPTLVKRIPTGKTPSHLWIDSKSTTVWSSIQDDDDNCETTSAATTARGGWELEGYLFIGNGLQVIGLQTVPADRAGERETERKCAYRYSRIVRLFINLPPPPPPHSFSHPSPRNPPPPPPPCPRCENNIQHSWSSSPPSWYHSSRRFSPARCTRCRSGRGRRARSRSSA